MDLSLALSATPCLQLTIVERDGRLLLGLKKKGFGSGYYNGFGGKVEAGETIQQAAHRELLEEAGIAAVSLQQRGILTFAFDDQPLPWEVHVFHCGEYAGEPTESDEMAPVWMMPDQIPYDKMWADDVFWYPFFLQNKLFQARAHSTTAAQAQPKIKSITFEGVNNIRDLAEACEDMKPGAVFRTAAPVEGTPADLKALYTDMGIRDLIDLRSTEEVVMQGPSAAFEGQSYCRFRRDPAVRRVVPDASSYLHGDSHSDIMRVQIAVMEKSRYYWSIVSRMGKRRSLQLALTAIVDKTASRRIAIEWVNEQGLEGLYTTLLEDSSQEFVAVLRHIKSSVEQQRPVMFFCKAGKDRTGLTAMLLLSILGCSEEQILQDYVRSDEFHMVALAGLEENPKVTGLDRAKFERAPREAMHHALQFIKQRWGGVHQYLVEAGFGRDEQQQLRDALLMQQPRHVALSGSKL
eukprot:gene10394-10552_t